MKKDPGSACSLGGYKSGGTPPELVKCCISARGCWAKWWKCLQLLWNVQWWGCLQLLRICPTASDGAKQGMIPALYHEFCSVFCTVNSPDSCCQAQFPPSQFRTLSVNWYWWKSKGKKSIKHRSVAWIWEEQLDHRGSYLHKKYSNRYARFTCV